MSADSIARALKARRSGAGWMAKCPAHDDNNPSLSIRDADGKVLLHCHAGCGQREVIEALKGKGLWAERPAKPRRKIVATYDYTDEAGHLLYQVLRTEPKGFFQRRPDGEGGWINKKSKRQVLFHLREVIEAPIVFVVEGEKDVETLRSQGFVATTNAGGAEAPWLPEFSEALAGREVIVIPDNDKPGRDRAARIARALIGRVTRLVILELEGAKDVTDWFDKGHGELELIELLKGARGDGMTNEIRDETDIDDFIQRFEAGAAAGPDLLSCLYNDHGNAERLIAMYGEDLRFCHAFKKWLVWDGMRWAVDDTDQARRLAKQAMLEFLKLAIERGADEKAEKFARASLDARRIGSMLSMAECEIYVRPADLDTDPFALNFLNGTVDLRTGAMRDHRRSDFITKLVRYRHIPLAVCPRWLAFLDQVMGGGPDAAETELDRSRRLVAYLRRALGYSLTGTTIEKAVFIPFGTGDNGKSTMLSTFRNLVEEYSHLLQVDTLMVRQESNNTQADLADLRGARFVQTSETEEGQRLAQGKLKRITQGMGKIKATRKYENPIEFAETHKLWMDTNRKPTIRDVDDKATFNRLHPIPFTVTIPKEKIDRELPDKLLGEAEGILAWAVEGARLRYAEGLSKPAEVEAAKEQWREDMDQLGRFIEERCVVGDAVRAGATALYADYKQWAINGGDRSVLTSTAFGTKLADRGFGKRHSERGAVYIGIGLRADDHQPPR